MAKKKKENTLSYLQMPLPSGGKYYKMTKVAFGGLNKRYTLDSGVLSMENNISTNEYPYITPSEVTEYFEDTDGTPIGLYGFDNFLLLLYKKDDKVYVDYITEDETIYTGLVSEDDSTEQRCIVQFNVYDTPTDPISGEYVKKLLFFPDRASMFMNIEKADSNPTTWNDEKLKSAKTEVMYCYDNGSSFEYYTVVVKKTTDAQGKATFTRELVNKCKRTNADGSVTTLTGMFFCDGMIVDTKSYTNSKQEADGTYPPPETASHNYYYINEHNGEIYRWVDDEADSEKSGWKLSLPPTMPNIKYATVHLSRVFGVDDDRVYASGFNNYANWNLDTIGEYNESNSWCSPSQSNTKAGGKFTGITTFQSHVVCFKRDFMHEIYNTKNPFRLQDIYAEGCIDNRTIQDVDGKLIFVSEDGVKIYTGSNPRVIDYELNMSKYRYAVSGTDNRNYYLYCEDDNGKRYLYVYDTLTQLWSEQSVRQRILSFAHNKNGMYMLLRNGNVNKMDSGQYRHSWSFETDLITNQTVNIKHIKKLQMLVDIPEEINGEYNLANDLGDKANLQVYILYDDEDFDYMDDDELAKRLVYSSNKYGKFPIRVKPRNTANYGFKLHFEGSGYVKLYELEIFVEAGGDMYV